ncbi:MAG: Glutathione S-transferase U1 [Geoglossum simile]|nr:MAG: Glutathione S-transferase U1 [Geoglossum simile]
MDDAEAALQQQLPAALRQLQPAALQAIQHSHHHSLGGPLQPDLQNLDTGDPNALRQRLQAEIENPGASHQHAVQSNNAFEHAQHHHPHMQSAQVNGQPLTPQHQQAVGGQFGMLTPGSQLASQSHPQHNSIGRLQQDQDLFNSPESPGGGKADGHLDGLKLIPNPPNLQEWREKLFNVNEIITLTEEEFQTYFPHVDNIYSHRSTQRYKRKPFVSHYWDCRLKGRPPGTPKSDDPNKKKRKRTARQRDLCDVKIKITEYFPGSSYQDQQQQGFPPVASQNHFDPSNANNFFAPGQPGGPPVTPQQPFGTIGPMNTTTISTMSPISQGFPVGHPGATGQRYYTIQRVNGNGGNGKGDGVAGPHKHTLEESDRVKKNSVQRYMLKEEKQKKKTQRHIYKNMSDNLLRREQKTYHKKATGAALATVKKHSKDHELKLFGSCFCPFVQRVWIALELKGLGYQYVEVDPYKKPDALLEVNPRGLVPALRHGDWGSYESTVLLEYLEDLGAGAAILPPLTPQLRAHCRLWADHVNRHIIPGFYRYLQAQEIDKQVEYAEELKTEITKLVDAADPSGPYFLGPNMTFVDVQFAPWVLRLSRVLKPYRGWPDPEEGSRWGLWVEAIEGNEAVKATTSTDDLYLDSYERYAGGYTDHDLEVLV